MNRLITEDEKKEIKEKLNLFAGKLEEYVKFGNSILEEIGKKPGGNENYVAFMLLRHFIELMDSVGILVENCSIDPCDIVLRSMIETTIGMEYMFQEDFERRTNAFVVASKCKDRNDLLKMVEGTEQSKQ